MPHNCMYFLSNNLQTYNIGNLCSGRTNVGSLALILDQINLKSKEKYHCKYIEFLGYFKF